MLTSVKYNRFAEVVVNTLARIEEGEEVLIVTDTESNLDIADAFMSAAMGARAEAELLILEAKSAPTPRSVVAAMKAADVVLHNLWIYRSFDEQATLDAGARILMTNARGIEEYVLKAVLEVDVEKMLENGQKLCDLMSESEVCRVTSEEGTDLAFSLTGRPCLLGGGTAFEPGEIGFYPGAQVSIAPVEETINGTMVVDASINRVGLISTPVVATLEEGVITSIEGGEEAEAWKSLLESYDEPKVYRLCHFSVGLNPLAEITGNFFEDERFLGGVDFGFGNQLARFEGKVGKAKAHSDVMLASPTIHLGDKVIVEANQLNPDLGFHQLARPRLVRM